MSETQEPVTAAEPKAEPKAAKKPKKEAIEDKPFGEFVHDHFLPALAKAFAEREYQDLELSFVSNQLTGKWDDGQKQFTLYFPDGDIQGRKAFSESTNGVPASTIEPFLIDERKVSLDLLVFGVIQRINAQKWFGQN